MIGRDFEQQNVEFGPPEGMSVDEVRCIPACKGANVIVTCWQPTEEERKAIALGGPVWIEIFGTAGNFFPMRVHGEDPFERGYIIAREKS